MLALAAGSFAIGTGEFVIMGLLPEVAKDIGATIPQRFCRPGGSVGPC
jgi:DHA1 family inner membrane transport protein